MNFNLNIKAEDVQAVQENVGGGNSFINYNQVFTGPVKVKPEVFNPTKADLIRVQNITNQTKIDGMKEPVYTNAPAGDKTATRITLLCSFNPYAPEFPNAVVELTEDITQHGKINQEGGKTVVYVHATKRTYPDKMFVNYSIEIGKEVVVGTTSGKTLVIDDKNISAWVLINDGESVADAVRRAAKDDALSNDSKYRNLHLLNPATSRASLEGEVDLYNLLFSMAGRLKAHEMRDGVTSGITGGFAFGQNPTQLFMQLVDGGQYALNEAFIKNPGESFLMDNGDNCKIGMMLVAKVSDKVNTNGENYVNQYAFQQRWVESTSKYNAPMRKVDGETRSYIPKDVFVVLNSEARPYPNHWSYEFMPFVNPNAKSNTSDITLPPAVAGGVDQLPF